MSKHYANPQDYGWQYQGYNAQSRVAFYSNNEGVKMDYYYSDRPQFCALLPAPLTCRHALAGPHGDVLPSPAATGTVKTSMDHPTAGKTQMFRRDLDNAAYERVLENPRAHTGQGYQTKTSLKKSFY
jgi:hypothetical protein